MYTRTTKRCPMCGKRRRLENFHRSKRSKNGRGTYCRDCASELRREYYLRNQARRREDQRRYAQENPDKVRERYRQRRARKTGAEGSHTEAQWRYLCRRTGNRCLRCGVEGVPLARDHIVPLTREGSDSIENIQPLCGPCNSWKGTKIVDFRRGKVKAEPPPTGEPQRRVTMKEAADELGLTVEAIRKRIQRGSLRSDKGQDGRRYVYLDEYHREVQGERSELVEELRDRVSYLERQVEEERDARRRADTLLAQLMQRIPELEAPQERSPDAPRGEAGGASREEAPPASDEQQGRGPVPDAGGPQEGAERSWWRRVFGG